MSVDRFRGVPEHLIREQRFDPFPPALTQFPPLRGMVIPSDVSHLPVELVRQIPESDWGGNVDVQVDEKKYQVQIVKSTSIFRTVSLGVRAAGGYLMDAHINRPTLFLSAMEAYSTPFLPDLPPDPVVVSIDLKAKINGEHYPPFRAKNFIPWALQVLAPYQPTHFLAEWEPDSDNHARFYEVLRETGDPVVAAKSTWTHEQLDALGHELVPKIGIIPYQGNVAHPETKVSPQGNPSTRVFALYKLK